MQELEQKKDIKKELAIKTVQKQYQVLKLREWLIIIGLSLAGGLLRVPMQVIPSVEPITFFAVLGGWLFGKNKGFLIGATSLYVSNFLVMGGHGPWTFVQMFAFGIAGYIGGYLRKGKWWEGVLAMGISTLVFEIILNTSSVIIWGGNIFAAFLMGIPFMGIHLVSNLFFGLFLKKGKDYTNKKGEFNEMGTCIHILNKHNIKPKLFWNRK